jgi:hypothetical protein
LPQLPHVYEVGVLGAGKPEYAVEPMKALRAAMAELGWRAGRLTLPRFRVHQNCW